MKRAHAERICAGCKVSQRIPADSLCPTCAKEWANLRRFGPVVEQLAARETHPVFMGERCFIPKAAVYVSKAGDDEDSGTPTAAWFAKAMRDLLVSFCMNYPVTKGPEWSSAMFHSSGDGPARYLNYRRDTKIQHALEMTSGQVSAVHTLYRAINELLNEAKREGQERGQDLIQQLAAGEVTSDKFDQHLEDIARANQQAEQMAERWLSKV